MPISVDGLLGVNSSGNIETGGFFLGDGGLLSNITTGGNAVGIVSGNSSISFDSGGNAVINIGGANIGVLTPAGLEITGNIIPTANIVYTLGNSTNQWKDLWVSNNTIYINSIPLTIGDGSNVGYGANTLFVNSNPVVTTGPNVVNSGNVVTTGNLSAGNGVGNVTTVANVGIIFPDGTVQTTAGGGGPGNYGNANVTLLLSDGSVTTDYITTANVSGSYILGNGAFLTGMYSNTNVSDYLSSGTVSSNILTTGNVSGNYFIGNGSLLTGVISSYGDSNVSAYLAGGTDTANIITTGNISGQYYIGNGSLLTGMYSNVDVAAFLPTYTGDLTAGNITVTGNTVSNTLSTGANGINITSNLINSSSNITINPSAGGAPLSGTVIIPGNLQVQGTTTTVDSNVVAIGNLVYIAANNASDATQATGGGLQVGPGTGYATWLYDDVANTWYSNITLTSGNGVVVNGALTNATEGTFTGNLTAGYLFGDGSNITGINYANVVGAYGNANVSGYLASGTNSANITTTGNVVGAFVYGDGSYLTNINASNITGAYGNANVSNYLASGTNAGNITTSGNVVGAFIYGDGSHITNLPASNYGNANVAAFLPTYSGNILNLNAVGNLSAITPANSTNTTQVATTAFVQNVVTAAGGYGDAQVETLLSGGGVGTNIITTANVYGQYFVGNGAFLTGIATSYGDANVATYLSSGNVTTDIITTGNVNGQYFVGNGALLTDIISSYGDSNVTTLLASGNITTDVITSGNVNANVVMSGFYGSTSDTIVIDPLDDGLTTTGNVIVLGNLQATGNITYNDISTAITDNLLFQAANAASNQLLAYGGGLAVGPQGTPYATWTYSPYTSSWMSNIAVTATTYFGDGSNLAGMYSNASASSYLSSGVDTAGIITTGNVQAAYFIGDGSLLTGGYGNADVSNYLNSGIDTNNIVTQGNIQGSFILGDGSQLTNLPIGGNYGDANVEALLEGGTLANNIVTTGDVTSGNITTGNITVANVNATAVYTNNYLYANGAPLTFNQPVLVTSNIVTVSTSAPILVAADYSNVSFPGGIFTLYQPGGAVVTGSMAWASGGTSKNAYANYAGNVVNSQNIAVTLNCVNGTFNVQASDTITIDGSTVTGANLTGLGISGTGGTYTIPYAMLSGNVQTDSTSVGNVSLTTSSGVQTATLNALTTVAPVPFSMASVTAAWANANVILGASTQTFSWNATSNIGTIVSGNVTLAGSSNLVLSTSNATSGISTAIASDTGPYDITASYFGTGLNGAGDSYSNVTYSLTPANDIAPLFWKITGSNANPNFTLADSHNDFAFTVPTTTQGTPMPVGAQGANCSNVTTNYTWFALPGGIGTWNFGNSTPASGNVNIYACVDQTPFNQITLGDPSPGNFGQVYYGNISGVPYTFAGWSQGSISLFLYFTNIN